MWLFRRMVTLACMASVLLAPGARPADCQPEKRGSSTSQPAGKAAKGDCSLAREEDSLRDGSPVKGPEKRGFFGYWSHVAEEAQATQPDWLSPLFTTSGRLKQEFRYDIWDQPSSGGGRTYQFGGNKGLEFVTSSRTQLLVGVPVYTLQSESGTPGGFGDLPLMLKFRIASGAYNHGNYLLTFLLGATAPTGAHRYGADAAVLTPALAFGKGWGRFNAQSTLGANLPTGDTAKLGRQLQWNTAFQYRAFGKLWPELEVNSTFYETGKYAGNNQVFLTPGLGFGRMRLGDRFRFSSAAGIQIAATSFHTYNHRWVFSQRLSF
jgi:hypothetical protein